MKTRRGATAISLAILLALLAIEIAPHTASADDLPPVASDDAFAAANRYLFGSEVDAPRRGVRGSRGRLHWGVVEGLGEQGYEVTDHTVSPRTGVSHISMHQTIGGIKVWGSTIRVSVDREGRVLNARDRFRRHAPDRKGRGLRRPSREPMLSAIDAVREVSHQLGLDLTEPLEILEGPEGEAQRCRLSGGGISAAPIPVEQMILQREEANTDGTPSLRRVWKLLIRDTRNGHLWSVLADAHTGEILRQVDLARSATYRVFPLPAKGPQDSAQLDVTDPAHATASPYGWHVRNSGTGYETEVSEGNNATVQEDWNGDDAGGISVDGGSERQFLFDADFVADPTANLPSDAAATNVFYWMNVLHDIFFSYGFDEASGNFQFENYTAFGVGGDQVFADIQDSAKLDPPTVNNARFFPAVDGEFPHLDLHLFVTPEQIDTRVSVDAPASIAFDYGGRQIGGPSLDSAGVTGELRPAGDACSPLAPDSLLDAVAIIDGSGCGDSEPEDDLATKLTNAEAAGAVAVAIVDPTDDDLSDVEFVPSASIPVVHIGASNGTMITTGLDASSEATLQIFNEVDRIDSAFSNDLLVHEYAHGLSSRLVDGPNNILCMSNTGDPTQQAGIDEGWADFFALALTARASDTRQIPTPFGAYTLGEVAERRGHRRFPYSTDMSVNPLTYVDVSVATSIHQVGTVWASMLWELYWRLIDRYGFSENLYGDGDGGNNVAIQLAVEALRHQACEPTFVDGREALLDADLALHPDPEQLDRGLHHDEIWCALATRGLGEGALGFQPDDVFVVESFQSPVACPEPSPLVLAGAALLCLGAMTRTRRDRSHFSGRHGPGTL